MLLGGHLWSEGYSLLLSIPLLIGGMAAVAWGIFTSHLVGSDAEPPQA